MRTRHEQRSERPWAPGSTDAFSQAVALVLAPVCFGFVGHLLDSWLGTGRLFMLVFALVGVLGAMTTAYYRYLDASAREDAARPWRRKSAP